MSYGIYIGKNLSATGHAWLAGYGDEPSSHWLEVIPAQSHTPNSQIQVGVTPQANLPGVLSFIPQAKQTHRHIRVGYSHYKGVPAPLTNGGLNEFGVAVRDIWSTSRPELIAMTPTNQQGPNYSDLARMVLQRATTARQGVELIADLISTHGYSTYGGNSHLIADADEAWVVIECAGGKGLWAAERLGPNSIRASRPGYILDMDISGESADFLYPPHMVEFAQQQGWYNPEVDNSFNFNQVFGDQRGKWDGVSWIEGEMQRLSKEPEKISLEHMIWAIRTEKLTGDTAGYGQVVPLVTPKYKDLRMLWHSQVGAIASPMTPIFMGLNSVPLEFQQHRYLSSGESARFMDTRHALQGDLESASAISQGIESTQSACQIGKRVLYLILQRQDLFLDEATQVWQSLEAELAISAAQAASIAEHLCDAGAHDLACHQLSYYSHTELARCLRILQTMALSMETRTRLLGGINTDLKHLSADQIW